MLNSTNNASDKKIMVLKYSVARIKRIPLESFLKRAALEIIRSESYEVSNVQSTV